MLKNKPLDEQPIVKFQGKFWVVYEERDGMLILMQNGERAITPVSSVEFLEERKKGGLT